VIRITNSDLSQSGLRLTYLKWIWHP